MIAQSKNGAARVRGTLHEGFGPALGHLVKAFRKHAHVKSAASAEAENAGTGVAEYTSEAEIFQNYAADGCVSAGGKICLLGDEKRLSEEPGCRDAAESPRTRGH